MGTLVRLDDRRAFDPLDEPEIKRFFQNWYRHSVGGAPRYAPCLLTPFLGIKEGDPLHAIRYSMPKIMLAAQPVAHAWAHDEVCDLDYVCEAVPHHPKLVVREWLDALVECGAVKMVQTDHIITYLPERRSLYKSIEIMLNLIDCVDFMREQNLSILKLLQQDRDWTPIGDPLPTKRVE